MDNGHRYTFKGVGEFIGRFERMLSAPAPSGLGIPVVNLVVEGGIGALSEVREFLQRRQMVVIVEGTGRMAVSDWNRIILTLIINSSRDAQKKI